MSEPPSGRTLQCPHCTRPIGGTEAFCPHCGGRLTMTQGQAGGPAFAPAPLAATRRRGPRAEVAIGLLILVTVAVGVAVFLTQQKANEIVGNIQTAFPTVRPPQVPQATVKVLVDEYQAAIGERVSLNDGSGNDLGDVTVVEAKKYSSAGDFLTADRGRVFAGARVRYDARAEFSYNQFDWVAHDDEGNQFEALGYPLDPELSSGTLAAGRKVVGWVAFDVPKGTKHLWIDYQTFDGTVIFSVPLF